MVDEIKEIGIQPRVITEQDARDEVSDKQAGKSLVTRFRQRENVAADDDSSAFRKAMNQIEELRALPQEKWTASRIRKLIATVALVIKEKREILASLNRADEYAIEQGTQAVLMQLRQAIHTLNPPAEMQEKEEFQELLELLLPPSMRRTAQSEFKRGSASRGQVKTAVSQQLLQQALQEASQKAGQKLLQQGAETGLTQGHAQFSRMSLEQMSRFIKRKLKQLKKGKIINEDGELEDMTEEEKERERKELQELMELFSFKALETMRSVREEIAPRWVPERQPWLIRQADQQVFDILLATADRELLEETQSWDEIQNLREGNAVFTLRAADKLTEAAARKT